MLEAFNGSDDRATCVEGGEHNDDVVKGRGGDLPIAPLGSLVSGRAGRHVYSASGR